jgi:AIPR protein
VLECIARESGSYVALTRLDDYYRFVTDENGNLRRYLFESNVRDYLGENRVNEDIGTSLKEAEGPEFWWLNNGITLLVTAAIAVGKVLQLHDVQIVNGLQTTETIFRHFSSGNIASAERGLLVKVVVSSDPVVRDQIIRATNNQSSVEAASLHATDKLQRDIEEVLSLDVASITPALAIEMWHLVKSVQRMPARVQALYKSAARLPPLGTA